MIVRGLSHLGVWFMRMIAPLPLPMVRGMGWALGAASGRVILIDRRGTGLSDRVREVQSLETAMDDIRAVMDDIGSETAVIWTGGTGTGIGVLFATLLLIPGLAGLLHDDARPARCAVVWPLP